MEHMSSEQARRGFGHLLNTVLRGEHVAISRHGEQIAVVVPAGWYEQSLKPCRVDGEAEGGVT